MLFRFHGNTLEDVLVGLTFEEDSLLIDLPTDTSDRLVKKVPNYLTHEGYQEDEFNINIISPKVIRLSIYFEESNTVIHYWLNKDTGLEFMFSSSEYFKIIGIPTYPYD